MHHVCDASGRAAAAAREAFCRVVRRETVPTWRLVGTYYYTWYATGKSRSTGLLEGVETFCDLLRTSCGVGERSIKGLIKWIGYLVPVDVIMDGRPDGNLGTRKYNWFFITRQLFRR